MSEAADWKQKYRDSLLELEAEEKRWRDIEQVLRRLVGRLCAAGMGVNAQLDDELTALAAANRRNADALELEKLAASLTTTVVAVDAIAPVMSVAAAPLRWNATCAELAGLLEELRAADNEDSTVQGLLAGLSAATNDAALAAVMAGTAALVRTRGDAVAGERERAAQVLSEVTKRLEEMAGYLTESNSASRTRFDDAQSLNDTVLSHVRELNNEVSGATELGLLQSMVRSRLDAVAEQVCAFRARESDRLLESNGRADRMRARIADLERETQELHSKLDLEKHVARLDPLTCVANRKSYDERFALEIGRHAEGAPLVMLLWDIDNFKTINDSYGHRAGDRVLQSVAGCFKSSLRSSDFVARIGGEEFAVLLNGLKLAEAMKVANQLRIAVEALRFHFRGMPVRVTVSCGISQLKPEDSAETAYERADRALYQAKGGGKNLCVAA
jgi:diguanylate cyclase